MNGLFRASCCHLIIAEKAPAVLYKFKCLQYITSPLLQQLFSGNTFRESICTRNLNPIVASPCLKLCPEKLEKYDSLDDVEISFLSGGQLEIGSGSSPKIVKSDFGEEITFESHGVSSFSGKDMEKYMETNKIAILDHFGIVSFIVGQTNTGDDTTVSKAASDRHGLLLLNGNPSLKRRWKLPSGHLWGSIYFN